MDPGAHLHALPLVERAGDTIRSMPGIVVASVRSGWGAMVATDSIGDEVHVIDLQTGHSKPIVEDDLADLNNVVSGEAVSPALTIANDFLAVAYVGGDALSGITDGRVALFSCNAPLSPNKLHELCPFQTPTAYPFEADGFVDISVCGTRLAVMWNSSIALLDLRGGGAVPAELNAIGSFDFGLSVARAGPVGLAPAGLDLAHLVATLDDQGYLRVWDFDVNPAECVLHDCQSSR